MHYSSYTEEELNPAVNTMLDYLSSPTVKHESFFRKYSAKKFMKAALFVQNWMEESGLVHHVSPQQ